MGNVTSPVVSRRNIGFMKFIGVLVMMVGLSVSEGWGQTITWANTGTGTAWYTQANWSPNTTSTAWTTSNLAQFANSGSATTAGINIGTSALSIGAIEVTSARTRNLTIGNSSGTSGNLTLNGITVNTSQNIVLYNGSGSLLTIQDNENGTGKTMGLSIANTTENVIYINSTGGITISSIISGSSKNLTKAGAGAGVLSLSGANSYTGKTTITAGTLRLGATNAIPVAATGGGVTLNGGTLSTGATTGYSEGAFGSTNMGVLILSANSTIALGTGNHSLFFANSSAETWAGSTLTITGWTGTAGSSGTAGKIYVGSNSSGLTSAQLAKISFSGYTAGAQILSSGEIVPPSAPTVTSSAATTISTTSATLNGNVTSDGGATISERGFVYKTSAGATINDNKTTVSGTTGTFTLTPTLSVNTQYYYKAYAINSVNTTLSSEQNFWTLANVPTAPTVSNATPTTLDVAVNVNSNPATTEFAIQETTGNLFVQANGSLGVSAVWQTAAIWGTKTVTGLSSGTSYTFQVKARNGANTETAFGSSASLSTASVSSPTIFTSGTISAVNTTYGTASASPSSFNVSGSAMEEGVLVTPPSGFEVSLSAGSGYANTITVGSAGTIASTPVYVRLKATATVDGSPYSGNIVLSSANATSVNAATVSSTVTPYTLTVSGLSGVNKVYDGLTTAGLTGTPTLSSTVNSDVISLSGTAVGTFATATVANSKPLTITGLSISGTNSSSYSLTAPTATANITAAPLTITGISIAEKTYNGNTSATITGTANYSGLVNSESFTVTGTPSAVFVDANVNTNIAVTVSGYMAPSANYSVTQPTGLTGNIVKANQTITLASTATNYIGAADYSPATSASSGVNAITYTSSNTNVASIVAGKIRILAVGETTITASQAESANYNAAADVTQVLTVQVNTDYFRSKASGDWNAVGTWECSANGTSGWANAPIVPGATNSVYIQSGHTVTLTQNEACKDLNIANSTTSSLGTRGIIALGNFTLSFYGKLRSYYGSVGTIPGANASNGFNAYPFTSTGGKLSVVGDTRNLTNTGEWGAALSTGSANFPLEINLNSGQTVTAVANIKCSSLNVVSGTFEFSTIGLDNGIVGQGDATIATGATIISSATSANAFQKTGSALAGTLTVNGTLVFTGAAPSVSMTTILFNGTIEYSKNASQTFVIAANSGANPNTYTNLKINNTAGISLTQNTSVNGTLDLTSGKLATGAYTLTIGADGSVTNASSSSYVNGNLVKLIKAGTDPVKTFEIGDATTYAPVSVAITGTITNSTGSIQAVTTSGDHVNIATTGLFKTVNRKWTLSSSAAITGLTSYNPTFNFVSGDIDAGATTSNFVVKRYASSAWTAPTTGTKTATSTQATGLAAYGDFVIGEVIGAPTATAATNVTSSSFRLNLNAVTDATGYFIDVATDEAFTSFLQNSLGIGLNTFYNLSFLSANSTYYYRVRAAGANGSVSPNSNVISVTTLASYNITVSSSDVAKGSVSGGGAKDAGASVSLTATPASASYRFVNWTENGSFVSKTNPYVFSASSAKTLVANFTDAASPIAISTETNASTFADCTTCDVTVSAGAKLTIDESKTFNSVTVAAGGQVSLASGSTLTSPVTLQSSASGTATFINENTGAQSIAGVVENYLAHTRNWYVSSPVSNAVAPAGYTYYQRDEAGASWTSKPFVQDSVFLRGRGYIALPGSVASKLTFNGTLNHGNIPVYLTASGASSTGFNLIGNPYPAHLTWTKAFVDANAALIEPTIYYRTTTGTLNNVTGWSFKSINASTGEVSPVGTTAVIPPMQAFWIKAKQTGTLTLNSSLTRSHETGNPLKAPATVNTDRKRLRLQVSNGDVRTDETLIYFDSEASDSYDSFDSPRFEEANTVTQLYSLVGSKKLVINGMNSFADNTELPLGFVAGAAGAFNIAAIQMNNIESDVQVLLKDQKSGAIVDLRSGGYMFTSDASNDTNRFSVIFKSAGTTTGVVGSKLNSTTSVVVNANKELLIKTGVALSSDARVSIYNAVGQLISVQPLTSPMQTISTAAKAAGVYWVKISNGDDVIARKIVIK